MTKNSPSPTAFNQKHGFTLSGWLVRIFLYSCVITALMLPNYNFQCNGWFLFCSRPQQKDAKVNIDTTEQPLQAYYQAKAKTTIEKINRAQQAYYLKSGYFANSIAELDVKITTETEPYYYQTLSPMLPVQALNTASNSTQNFQQSVIAIAQTQHPELKHYLGAVFASQVEGTDKMTTLATVCAVNYNALPTTLPTLTNDKIHCPPSE